MDLLKSLQLNAHNSGTFNGKDGWATTQSEGEIISCNPATGQAIASVYRASKEDYDQVIKTAQETFLSWRNVPAPKRGELVRLRSEALRHAKDTLGSLVSLEMGKSKQEGNGEVHEMIDMADLAVGQ